MYNDFEQLAELWPKFLGIVSSHSMKNPISVLELADELGNSARKIDDLIDYGIQFEQVFIATSSSGYFLPQSQEEALECLTNLRNLKKSLDKRIRLSDKLVCKLPLMSLESRLNCYMVEVDGKRVVDINRLLGGEAEVYEYWRANGIK
jgi:hypothetical protein